MEHFKLTVLDNGDPDVGIQRQYYTIECPFDINEDSESKEYFRQRILKIYNDWAEGRTLAFFQNETEG